MSVDSWESRCRNAWVELNKADRRLAEVEAERDWYNGHAEWLAARLAEVEAERDRLTKRWGKTDAKVE